MSKGIWVVRAGRGAAYIDDFLDKQIITIGMSHVGGGDLLKDSRKQLAARIAAANPEWSKGRVSNHAGQLYRFLSEMDVGDEVATSDPGQRRYLLGKVITDPSYAPSTMPTQPYLRSVKWDRRVPRDALSVGTRNSLGAIQTIFRLNAGASAELRKVAIALDAGEDAVVVKPKAKEKDSTLADLRAEMIAKASEFVEDMIADLEPDEMEQLVAGVLRAMGYKARVTPKGPDRGVDIFASPDGLGLQEPRIFVEVKHRLGKSMGSQDVRAFLGGRQTGDRCLYVSTGGFTKDARYEAERANVPLTLLSLPELRELVTENYEQLDLEAKRLVPLTQLYWPVPGEE